MPSAFPTPFVLQREPALPGRARARGFSLLELLVVVGILALVAGGVIVGSLGRTEDVASDALVRSELTEIKQALLRFHADTGHLPKQGPFDLHDPSDPGAPGVVRLTSPTHTDWFRSPANFAQLFENPLRPSQLYADRLDAPSQADHPLADYSFDSRRGWNGPYLRREGRCSLPAGDDLTGALLTGVPGLADPFDLAGGSTTWHTPTVDDLGQPILLPLTAGRPYLLLTDPSDPASLTGARLVSLGSDGVLGFNPQTGTNDDVEVRLK